jgi:hypothetical protein
MPTFTVSTVVELGVAADEEDGPAGLDAPAALDELDELDEQALSASAPAAAVSAKALA